MSRTPAGRRNRTRFDRAVEASVPEIPDVLAPDDPAWAALAAMSDLALEEVIALVQDATGGRNAAVLDGARWEQRRRAGREGA